MAIRTDYHLPLDQSYDPARVIKGYDGEFVMLRDSMFSVLLNFRRTVYSDIMIASFPSNGGFNLDFCCMVC